jgi:hypothetical protein
MTAVETDAVSISVTIEGTFDFEVSDLWPDGDAPAQVTAEAVAELMQREGRSRCLSEWNLAADLDASVVVVQPNPHYGGDTVLFGEPPPPQLTSIVEEVWR